MTEDTKDILNQVLESPSARWVPVRRTDGTWTFEPKGKGGQITARSFTGANSNRLTADWLTTGNSLNADLRMQLRKLIERSRDLAANNEYVSGFLAIIESNVVGPTGFTLQSQARDTDGSLDKFANDQIEEAFAEWSTDCTVHGDMSFRELQALALRSVLVDGAPILRHFRGRRYGKFGYKVGIFEIDRLDPELNLAEFAPTKNRVIMGVEVDSFGRAVAYHLHGKHPGDYYWQHKGSDRTRIPADDIIHPYFRKRPEQTRGFPILASTMMGLRMLAGYKEAELTAARVAAAKMGFLVTTPGEAGAGYSGQDSVSGGKYMEAEAGVLEQLPAGMQFQQWDPQHPASAFGDFMRECLRGFASSLGISYITAANDYSQVSYSSGRMAMLQERETFKTIQGWMISRIIEPIYSQWIASALGAGAIGTPGANPLPVTKLDKFSRHEFVGRRWSWVDPAKEISAYIDAINAGLNSPRRVLAEMGLDEETILDEIAASKARREELGLIAPVDNPRKSNAETDPDS